MSPKSDQSNAPVERPKLLHSLGRLWRRFRHHVWQQYRLIAAAAFGVLVAVAFRLAEPWPLKYIFDGLLGDGSTGVSTLDNLSPSVLAAILVGAFLCIVLMHTGATFLSKLAIAVAFKHIMARVRSDVFAHLQRMSLLRHHSYGVGDLANRLSVDIDRIRLAGTNNAINLVVNVLTMFGMSLVMLWVNWKLALIALTAIPLFYVLSSKMTRIIANNARRFRASDGALSSQAVEAIGSVKTVQGLSLYSPIEEELSKSSVENLRLGTRGTILKAALKQSVTVLFAACLAVVVWQGVLLVQAGEITPGDLIVFMAYLREAMEKPMLKFSNNLAEIARGIASGERLLACLDEEQEPTDRPGASTVPPGKGEIVFDNVSFRYPGGPLILDKVSCTVRRGERVAIVGPSGGGKSTILALLLRLYEPQGGRILVDGRDIRDYTRQALRASIATVFQESVVFGMTVRDNLLIGNPDAGDAAIWEALELAAAHRFVDALDGRLDAELAAGGRNLSGGQRQRLGIARAALRMSPILLLDEPTSALDEESRGCVEQAIARLSARATVLMITHDLDSLDDFDRVFELRKGVLRASSMRCIETVA